MNSKTIIASLGLLSLSCVVHADDNPWEYYWAGSSQKKSRSYSQQYYEESGLGIGLTGLYAWATDVWQPDMAGTLFDIHENVATKSFVHQFSLTSGYMEGSDDFRIVHQQRKLVPILGGYTFHLPVSDQAAFYFGLKGGIALTRLESSWKNHSLKGGAVSQTLGMVTFNTGLGFSFSQHIKFKIGYECLIMGSNALTWHSIEAGLQWNF